MREDLVPALAPGGEDDGGLDAPRQLDRRARGGDRGVGIECVVLRDVQRRDAVLAEEPLDPLCRIDTWAHDERVEVVASGQSARERERLERELVHARGVAFDDDEDGHQATPIRCRTSTTCGAASGPWPRISASFFTPGGVTRRTFSSRGAGRAGELAATGFRCARMRPGTDG